VIRRRVLGVAFCLLTVTGCTGVGLPPASDIFRGAPEELPAPPEWRVGDRWVFGWTSGKESGSRTLEVRQRSTVNGVDYYIVNVGGGIAHYYTKDLHFAAAVQDGKVVARMVPPTPWVSWPLKPAATWMHRGMYEDAQGSREQNDTFTLAGTESVTVPSGTFRTYKITRTTDRGDSDVYWYAPEVRWFVRWQGRRGEVSFEEQLTGYHPAARTTSSAPSSR
jgi:hypothetical protein